MAGNTVGIGILGPVGLRVDDGFVALPGVRQQALLARLLVADGASVGSWQLRYDVWDGRHKSDAALRVAVSRLRGLLADAGAPDVIVRTSDGYRMDRRAVCVDADRFVECVALARASAESDPSATVDAVTEALAMWRGPAFGELADEPFVLAEAERLTSLRRDAIELRLAAQLQLGVGGLVPDLEAAVADAPLRERRTFLLMLALYRDGRQAEALAAYRRLTVALRDDLGLSPSAGLRDLERRILQHDPTLSEPTPTRGPAVVAPAADAVHAALGRARSARALARAGVVTDSLRIAESAVAAARELDAATLAECLVVSAQALALAGRAGDAVDALDEALALARRAGDPRVLASAAIVRFGFGLAEGDELLALLTEPLESLAVHEPQRVELLCAAMHQMVLRGGAAGAERLMAQAEAMAAAHDNPRSRAVVLSARAVLKGLRGCPPAAVRASAEEAMRAADESGDPTVVVAALHSVFRAAVEVGDLAGLESARERLAEVATESLFPFAVLRVGLLDVSLRLARGDLDGLEERVAEVEATGRAIGVVSSAGTTGSQRCLMAMERAQFDAVASLVAPMQDGEPGWRAVLALCLAEQGRLCEALPIARRVLAPSGERDGELARDWNLIAAVLAAEVAVLAGDADLARAASAQLVEARGRFAVVAHATVTLGPVDRVLGLLSLTAGDVDAAITALRAAVALAAQAPLWRIRSEIGLATALIARGGPGDAAEASRLFDSARQATSAAQTRGSAWLERQLERAVASTSTST